MATVSIIESKVASLRISDIGPLQLGWLFLWEVTHEVERNSAIVDFDGNAVERLWCSNFVWCRILLVRL